MAAYIIKRSSSKALLYIKHKNTSKTGKRPSSDETAENAMELSAVKDKPRSPRSSYPRPARKANKNKKKNGPWMIYYYYFI